MRRADAMRGENILRPTASQRDERGGLNCAESISAKPKALLMLYVNNIYVVPRPFDGDEPPAGCDGLAHETIRSHCRAADRRNSDNGLIDRLRRAMVDRFVHGLKAKIG
jgi:hypothetical protein